MLELKNVTYKVTENNIDKTIIDGLDLTVEDGKFIVITGPNGGGKSTLARTIMGINKITSGNIILDGEDITEKSITERAKAGISFAFQQPVVFKGIKVLDLLRLAAGTKISVTEACEYLSKVGLCAKEYINREVNSSLSGGELKRIEIATVIARHTKISIFDEPEAGIDLWSFNNLIQVFENIRKTINGTVIIISHQERIINIADEIVVIKDGKVATRGTKEEIYPELVKSSSITGAGCSKLIEEGPVVC
ncbi:MAG: ATP-binding cassette domain-containing protein [Lachnospiraceae bacterium]|nr:ATP-binding cassette domain-containing protein [Lachnospiraceae bacterium]